MILKCDNCKKEQSVPIRIKQTYKAIEYLVKNHNWFLGGVNTTLLCNDCRHIAIDNGWIKVGK